MTNFHTFGLIVAPVTNIPRAITIGPRAALEKASFVMRPLGLELFVSRPEKSSPSAFIAALGPIAHLEHLSEESGNSSPNGNAENAVEVITVVVV